MLKQWPVKFCGLGAKTIRKQENERPSKEAQISNRNFQRVRIIHSLFIFPLYYFSAYGLKIQIMQNGTKKKAKSSFHIFLPRATTISLSDDYLSQTSFYA